ATRAGRRRDQCTPEPPLRHVPSMDRNRRSPKSDPRYCRPMRPARMVLALGCAGVLLVALALLLAPALGGHVDDLDAQLHRVVIKNLLSSGRWLDLSFVPGMLPRYREHLPFTFWPFAVSQLATGSMEAIALLLALATVALVML